MLSRRAYKIGTVTLPRFRKCFGQSTVTRLCTTQADPKFVLNTIQPPAAHDAVSKWVIFSDLHVKGTSIDTCEEVLKEVHEVARRRNAGVIFLGDFWHVRGALNVELLNRVLHSLAQWTQPLIMIPGNHDQVLPSCASSFKAIVTDICRNRLRLAGLFMPSNQYIMLCRGSKFFCFQSLRYAWERYGSRTAEIIIL